MRTIVREALLAFVGGICLAGPVAAVALPLAPPAWRQPMLVWIILLGAVALVAWLRWRRR